MMNYSKDELIGLGISAIGEDVQIDRSVRFFNPEYVEFGSRVRVDCFSIISASPAGVVIGNNVHLAVGSYIFGGGANVTLEDFSGLSSRVCIYTSNDDYTSGALTNPTVPTSFRNVMTGPVVLQRYALVGSGSVVLPGVTIGRGASIGALTLVHKDVEPGSVVFGNPPRKLPIRRPIETLESNERRYVNTLTNSHQGGSQ